MRLNGIVGAEIPYYKMMNKAMPGPAKDTKRKPKNGRLTEIDPKTNKPRLKSGVPISRAVEVLYMFENTDVLPYQIEEMKVTISNLQTRVKKLEECIGCPYRTCPDCEKDCKIYKRYQKRLVRMEEDKEQERYLQEYAKRKQEKKNRKEGKR